MIITVGTFLKGDDVKINSTYKGMKKQIITKLISRFDKDGFKEDLNQEVQHIAPEDLIDIKFSTVIDGRDSTRYSALIIYKVTA
ncbi:MAG: hypothetical protein JST50_23135 [Bacteroidetes bacterium]|jgi:hypothetical protein|nr:hypothetical protein [Bacteroidota bacterium]